MDVRELEALEAKLTSMRRDRDQAIGAMESLKTRLKSEFGIEPEQLQEELERLETTLKKLDTRYDELIQEANRLLAGASA